jgi:subtilisin family serine protease
MSTLYRSEFRPADLAERHSSGSITATALDTSPSQPRGTRRVEASKASPTCPLILLLLAVSLPLVSAASPSSAAHPAVQYVEGEAIVTFKASEDFASAQRSLQGHSLQFNRHFAFLSEQRGRHSDLVHAANRTTAQLIAELAADPQVEFAEPNYLRWVSSSVPNDASFSQLWGLQNTEQTVNGTVGTAGDDIEFVDAWSLARTSSTPVVVAVIDTGVDYTHPDLAPNMWTNPGEAPANSVDDDGNGYVDDVFGYDFADSTGDPMDSGYHGSHVCGTIAAAGNNLLGIIGVNDQARIMALKASNDGSSFASSAIISALQYATLIKNRGVNIVAINASFGGGGSSTTESAAIQAAGNAGIIFCTAAGNSSINHNSTAVYPVSYRLSNMIVVAASDQNDSLASFSDYGSTTVDLAAPGVNVFSTIPTVTSTYVTEAASTYSGARMTFAGYTTGITATIYNCGLGYPTNFPAAVSNNIALISRGTLYFSQKVANAMAAGARAAIIYNNASGTFQGTLQYASNWIPAVAVSQADGQTLASLVPATGTVVNAVNASQSYELLDGTSMATPHVSGAVAFAAMNFPTETAAQRIQRVLANVDTTAGLKGLVITGGRLNLLRIVDTDRNGLPDWWEQTYSGALLGTQASADADGDGASNLAEWVAGTNPTNSSSCLRLLSPVVTAANSVLIRWPSVAGKSYRLERATNLLSGFNSIVRSNIAATPPINSEPDAAGLPVKPRYYRIVVEQ